MIPSISYQQTNQTWTTKKKKWTDVIPDKVTEVVADLEVVAVPVEMKASCQMEDCYLTAKLEESNPNLLM